MASGPRKGNDTPTLCYLEVLPLRYVSARIQANR